MQPKSIIELIARWGDLPGGIVVTAAEFGW